MITQLRFLQLTERERLIALPAAFALFCLLGVYFFIIPIVQTNTQLERRIIQKKGDILALKGYEAQIGALQQNLLRLRSTDLQRVILTIVEQTRIAETPDISQSIKEEGRQSLVLKLTELRSDQVVDLVYAIENHNPVIIIESMNLLDSLTDAQKVRITLNLRSE